MPYVSKEQLAQAREMDLLTYLQRYKPGELVHFSGNTYTTRTHDSLKISNGKWCWWSRGIGGSTALDYLVEVQGLSLPDAVARITGSTGPEYHPKTTEPPIPNLKTEFQLPPRHADNRRVFAYLVSRGIDPEIINHCIKHAQIYEDTLLFLGGGNEPTSLEFMVKLLGKETLDTRTRGISKGQHGSSSTNYQQAGRELMMLDELRMMDTDDAVLLIRGEPPVLDKKYDVLKHKNVKRTAVGGAPPYVYKPKADYALPDLPYAFRSLDDYDFIELEETEHEENS